MLAATILASIVAQVSFRTEEQMLIKVKSQIIIHPACVIVLVDYVIVEHLNWMARSQY